MDHIKILKRAWYILWSYRALWIFGLILALAGAGSHGNLNSSSQSQTNSPSSQQTLPKDFHSGYAEFAQGLGSLFHQGLAQAGITEAQLPTLIWIAVIFVLMGLALAIVIAGARYVAETAVIRMVDEYESTGTKMTIRQGFRTGWSRTSWRLFLINLLVSLPLIFGFVLLLALAVIVFVAFNHGSQQTAILSIIASVALLFLVFIVVAIVSIFLALLRNFFWRVCALENVGVRESLRRGFQMVRDNWKNVGIMWLVMIGLGIVWAVVSILALLLTLPVVAITGVIAALVAIIPAVLVGGLTSIVLPGWLPWIVGIVFVLPLFLVIAFSPWLLLGSWQTVFTSTVWTLVYRELKALPALASGDASAKTPAS